MRKTPQLLIEKLHLGELPPAAAASVRARLERDGELHRLDALAAEGDVGEAEGSRSAAFGQGLPDEARARILRAEAREAAKRQVRSRTWGLAVTAASFAVMALVIARPGDATRGKGGAALVIYRQTADARGYEPLAESARARAGDVLQLGVRPDGAKQAAIYSIDGRGTVTQHLAPRPVPSANELRLESAFQLDDAPAFERFLLVLGDALDEATIRLAIDRLAASTDPGRARFEVPGARVIERTIIKEARPP